MKNYSIDNQEPVSLEEIINDNELEQEQIDELKSLENGESCFIEIIEVKCIEYTPDIKLIEAASDLLKLAQDFCVTFESSIGYQKYEVNVFEALNNRYIQAKAAIKKATE